MKLKQLQCVMAVVHNGYSVTAAAESLHMSQPAVSKQIKLFEESLGMQVFKRNSRSFVGLTPLGDAVLPEIDRVLAGVDAIRELGIKSQTERFSQLNIATTNTLARYRLMESLPYMHKTYPNMPLNIIEGTNMQILEMVQNHEADFCWFSAMSLAPYHAVLRQMIYLPGPSWSSVLVVPKDHPLAQTPAQSLADIARFPLITYVTSHRGPSGLMEVMNSAGVAARVAVTARSADMIKGYVRQGLGVGVIADMAYDPVHDADLVKWPLNQWLADFQTYLAWHEEKRLRMAHFDFIERIIPAANKAAVQDHIRRVQIGEEAGGWAI